MVFIFQTFDSLPEEGKGIFQVEGNTGAKDIDVCKAFMLYGLLDEADLMFAVSAKAAGDKGGACHDRRQDWVHRHLDAAIRGALGLHALNRSRRKLAGRKPVDLVVHDNVGEI